MSSDEDRRRKLTVEDYKRMRYLYFYGDYTIRSIAGELGISTKYVKKRLPTEMENQVETALPLPRCSGCQATFPDVSGLKRHGEIWSSGDTKPLECMVIYN